MNIDELLRDYSDQDEYIARDMMILEVLINKGLITPEDISKVFTSENLTDYIKKDYLDGEIHKNKRYLKNKDGIGIWVHPIMMLPPWLPGHKFKNIIFER